MIERIRATQFDDPGLVRIRDRVLSGEAKVAHIDSEGILRMGTRLCVPKVEDLIPLILEEAHCSRYSIHPGVTKMYRDLSQTYWWGGCAGILLSSFPGV